MFYALSKLGFVLLRPSNLLLLLMVLALLLRWSGKRRRGAQLFALSFGLLLLCAWTILPSYLLRPLEQRFSPTTHVEKLTPTGIIMLGGVIDTWSTIARQQTQFIDGADRVIEVAKLARQFPMARIVICGGTAGAVDDDLVPEADLVRDTLLALGVAADRIELEQRSRNTMENARFGLELAQPKPGEQWLLVTSAFHMPRAMGTFRAAGWTGLEPWPVDYRAARRSGMIGSQYAAEGLLLTDLAIKEWIGLAAYRFAGFTDALFPAPAEVQR